MTPGWRAVVVPEPSGVENLTVQIKATGRAYPVFDLARLFLSSNDRLRIRFEPEPGRRTPPLVLCAVDGSLWLTHDEAKQHFIRSGLLGNFFNEEKVTVDPPKGVFTAIAVCGFSGAVLGPPNFHDYQRAIIRLHQERFKNMPLERYKSRVRIERDEELVKKWVESQSTQSRYTLLDGGENPPVFQSTEDAARYLLEHREAELFADAPSVTVPGTLDYGLLSPGLATHFRATLDQQRRFPLELVQELCRQFEGQGLRFFKENKRETYVSRSRPRPLDPGLAVSERVKAIVAHVRAHTGCTYNDVLVALAPKTADTPVAAPAETPVESSTETPAEAPAPVETPEAEEPSEADREGIAILQDLRWLIREGYVTEFANGELRVVERQEKPIIIQPPKRLRLYGRAFSLWTRPYLPPRFQPGVRLPGRGFTLWTKAHVLPPAKPVRPPKPGKPPRPEPAAAPEPPPEPVASLAEPAPLETPAPAPVETAPAAAEVSTPVETPTAE